MEELLGAMEKVKLELESMKAKMSSTQQSLAEKEAHLTTLRAERRRHLEEVLEMKYATNFLFTSYHNGACKESYCSLQRMKRACEHFGKLEHSFSQGTCRPYSFTWVTQKQTVP